MIFFSIVNVLLQHSRLVAFWPRLFFATFGSALPRDHEMPQHISHVAF